MEVPSPVRARTPERGARGQHADKADTARADIADHRRARLRACARPAPLLAGAAASQGSTTSALRRMENADRSTMNE
jgi:hypothetical protein